MTERINWIDWAKSITVTPYAALMFPIINLLFMHYSFVLKGLYNGEMHAFMPIVNLFSIVLDVAVVFLFFLCLTKGKKNLSVHLTFILTLIWSFSNILYSRFFYQCLSISALNQASNVFDGLVIKSIFAGFEWSDCFFVLWPAIYIIVALKKRSIVNITQSASKEDFILFTIMPLASFALSISTYSIYHFSSPHFRHHPELYWAQLNEYVLNPLKFKSVMPVNAQFISGSVRYIILEIADEFAIWELTNNEIEQIKKETQNSRQWNTRHKVNPQIKNVVYILLESFLSVSSDLFVDGKEITPFLNRLKKDSNTYYNGKIRPNITIGESGDGQLIYMSGLLPLRNKITVGIAKNRTLKGLPQMLKDKFGIDYTEIIIPNSPVLWEQRYMNKCYGIDKMYSSEDAEDSFSFFISEEKVFSLAKRTGKETKQPFFSMVLGISTHQPYTEPIDKDFSLEDSNLPAPYLNYLNACHYADKQIESYLSFLKEKNIYDNSLIVIVSDHHPHIDQLHMEGKVASYLPLYIINSGIDVKTMYNGIANQLDVYTTVLDILGIEGEWHGLGHTLLCPQYENSVDDTKYVLSEKIIMGDYFKKLSNN